MSSRTLGEAMQVGVSLAALSFCLCRLTVSSDMADGYGRLILDPSHLPADLRRFAVERDSTGIQTLQRDLLMSSDAQLQVAYTAPRPADEIVQKYVDIFGIEPQFGAPQDCLIVSVEALNRPLPQANQYARSMAEKQAIELLRERSARAGVAGLLRDMMLSSPAPVLTLDEAARQLTVSARTLRRHLAQEGVSLRDLQEETREALAEELLAGGMPVAEIADRLGYAQTSSFTQAFRRWKGVGPREYRDRLRDR
jgi:AraC-like DNA-binding protein